MPVAHQLAVHAKVGAPAARVSRTLEPGGPMDDAGACRGRFLVVLATGVVASFAGVSGKQLGGGVPNRTTCCPVKQPRSQPWTSPASCPPTLWSGMRS